MLSLRETQVQKVGNANQPQHWPHESRHGEPLLVMLEMRNGEPQAATAGDQLAVTSGKHVSHPVGAGAVGQRDDILVSTAEHIDGCFVDAAGLPTTVNDHAKTRKVTGKRSRQVIEYLTIEAGHSPAEQRLTPRYVACKRDLIL